MNLCNLDLKVSLLVNKQESRAAAIRQPYESVCMLQAVTLTFAPAVAPPCKHLCWR